MTTQALFESLTQTISKRRLELYRRPGDENLEVLSRYVWNICLSEALFPALTNLEIGLRNNIHTAAEAFFHNSWWFQNPAILRHDDLQKVKRVEFRLVISDKASEPERIVARLGFGFWVGLFDKCYERVLWPHLLKGSFPHMPSKIRTRSILSKRLNTIRRLRNMIFHNEVIINRPMLQQEHLDIIDMIGWLSPNLKYLTQSIDRFPLIHSTEYKHHIKTLFDEYWRE